MLDILTRKCTRCKKDLNIDCFHKDTTRKYGIRYVCKKCVNEVRIENKTSLLQKSSHNVAELAVENVIKLSGELFVCSCCKETKDKIYFFQTPASSKRSCSYYCISCSRKKKLNEYYKNKNKPNNVLSRARAHNARRNNAKKVQNTLTADEIVLLLVAQRGCCCSCKKTFSETFMYTLDHIKPLSAGGGLTFENTQLLCRSCNSSKNNKEIRYEI